MFDRKTCVGKDIYVRADIQNLDKKNVNFDTFVTLTEWRHGFHIYLLGTLNIDLEKLRKIDNFIS